MESANLWLAVAPVVGALIMLTSLTKTLKFRRGLPRLGLVVLLLFSITLLAPCPTRAEAASEVRTRLFAGFDSVFVVYDHQSGGWLTFSGGQVGSTAGLANTTGQGSAKASLGGKVAPGSAGFGEATVVRTEGTPRQQERLRQALELLAGTQAGSAALGDVLRRPDVTISFAEEVGVGLPLGQVLTTGGTAVTEGTRVQLSSEAYGAKSVKILAAMVAHELVHVAQNLESGSPWWQWPWTTVDREVTAHQMQAIVWAELRGQDRDWEQDRNLTSAQNPDTLRQFIKANTAYPWWLAPSFSC